MGDFVGQKGRGNLSSGSGVSEGCKTGHIMGSPGLSRDDSHGNAAGRLRSSQSGGSELPHQMGMVGPRSKKCFHSSSADTVRIRTATDD